MEKNTEATLRIGDIALKSGVRPSTIRYYETVGILSRPARASGQRRYDPSVLTLLRVIEVAKKAGFSVVEIKRLLNGFDADVSPSKRWQILARKKLGEIDAIIASANQMKRILEMGLECRCARLEDCRLVIA